MSKHGSLPRQIEQEFKSMLAAGHSKHDAKQIRTEDGRKLSDSHIYSYQTLKTYIRQCNYFTSYCKQEHGCRTLAECRQYVDEYLQKRVDAKLSPYTLKLQVSALAKLYQCPAHDLTSVRTPSRTRDGITRSRGDVVRDKHFSEARNADLVEFCRSTGLRRSELESLTGDQLHSDGGNYFLTVKGKGGRIRNVPIMGNVALVMQKCNDAGTKPVWGRVHNGMDVHSYRADYATRVYNHYARPLDTLTKGQKYFCRGDRAGTVFDRDAMKAASEALGHSRLSVVAEHYIHLD